MIKTYVFGKDKVETVDFDKFKHDRRVTWIDAANPTKEEKSKLSKSFDFSNYDINNCLDPEERARVENNKDFSLIIFKVPLQNDKKIATMSLGIFISKNYFVTVRSGNIDNLQKLAKELDLAMLQKLRYQYLLSQILLRAEREFFDVLNKMSEDVDKMENKLIRNSERIHVGKVFSAKKALLYFRTALITNRDALLFLTKGGSPFVNKRSVEDLTTENLQLMDMEEVLRGRLTETVNMYLSTVSNNLNVSMKYFAVIAALFLLPMLISGAYGMNFKILPLSGHPYGFWVIIGVMVVSISMMFLVFKRKEWI